MDFSISFHWYKCPKDSELVAKLRDSGELKSTAQKLGFDISGCALCFCLRGTLESTRRTRYAYPVLGAMTCTFFFTAIFRSPLTKSLDVSVRIEIVP